jgi:hypothetical protein
VERIQDGYQENPALTLYDELGLPPGASEEEIRETYLDRVRLLHPDLQREPSRKRQAESQMKRVNRAYAVLSDPDRRRRYDAALAETENSEAPLVNRKEGRSRARAVITLGWLICAFAGTVGIGWYVSQQALPPSETEQVHAAPAPPPASQPAQPPAAPDTSAAELESLRSDLAAAKAERDRALEQTILQAKELDFLTGRILSRPSAGAGRFAGVWVLPKVTTPASAYTPESVDLIVTEQQGTIQGRYRARYPGMGIPEAPMVRFYLEGKSQGDVADAVWSGPGGSKGEMQMKLASPNALQLVWSTTQPAKQSGPDSGTVALVRKIGP